MKAIVKSKREYGGIEVKEVPTPELSDDFDVIVSVKSTAICGSDVHAYEYPPSYEFIQVPVILGHEFSGFVKEVGKRVTMFKPGDRVMGESNKYCGVCGNCRNGKTNICYDSEMRGLSIDGVMAEYVNISEKYLHHVPENLSFSEAASAQACTISIHGIIDKTKIIPGETVVVFGPGIVGYTAAQLARVKGAEKVFIIGTNIDEELRLALARNSGFETINVDKDDIEDKLFRITNNSKVDTVIECSGASSALIKGLNILKKGGQITIMGIYDRPFKIPVTYLVRNEINVNTSYTSNWANYEKTLELLSKGLIDIKPLIKEYPLEEAQLAFKEAVDKTVAKPVFKL